MEMFFSFAGCLAIVTLLTQAIKTLPPINKLNSTWTAFVIAIIVGVLRIIFIKDYSASGIIVGILNIFAIYLGSKGSYDTAKQLTTKNK